MSKQVRVFLSADAFIKWVAETFPRGDDQRSDVQRALWAVCLQEAHLVANAYSTKDIAAMFLDGVPAKKQDPIVSIQDWLDTVYADLIDDGDVCDDAFRSEEVQMVSSELAERYDLLDVVEAVSTEFGINV